MGANDRRQNIADLPPEKRAPLGRRGREMSAPVPDGGEIRPRERPGPCALSFAQQRLWFLEQMEPDSCVYNVVKAVRLHGILHVSALRVALEAIVARHEVLRSTIVASGEEPMQVVGAPRSVELPLVDLGGRPPAEIEAELERVLHTEARRPFNLTADLMLRASLVRLGEREHVLLLTMHHIASDGWSMGVLCRELSALYVAAGGGRAPSLPPLPIQYADYAAWQREWLAGEERAVQLAYWKAQLAGAPQRLRLPTDRPRPATQRYRGARRSRALPRDLSDALRALSRRERSTLFMVLLAAFQVLLHRYAGEEDMLVGSAAAGRTRVETEPLIGFFVNTLVLRADLSGDPPFRAFLARVRDAVLGAYDHQDLPFEQLVAEARPARSLSWMPLVQVMFVLEDDDPAGLEFPGLTVHPVEVDTGTAKFDLTASVAEDASGLRVTLEYNTDLYEPGTVQRMLGHYETLLQEIVADAGQRLSQLPLLTEAERRQVLVDWNATQAPFPRTACIQELFEAQVRRSPDAVAIVSGEQAMTYAELNRRANQLAHYLRARGVGPDAAVGICLRPSAEMIVGLLAILKAGGAYLPLDPAYPKERLAFMAEDARAVALVTRRELAEGLRAGQASVILLDAAPQRGEPTTDPPHETTADHLAYLMYTSGSTGRPKAVAIPHRGVTRLVMNTDYVTITSADVMAQASNVSFDAATFEIWGALLNGARLVVVPREVVLSPAGLSDMLRRHGVTTLFLTTSLFNQIARELPSAFRTLRTLVFGGETAEPRWVEAVMRHGPPERLLNGYGPTEATTFACAYLVTEVPAAATSIPIGRPIRNTRVYLLDRHLNPVPIGVPGELHIGGPGVARGYLYRPTLTAERFPPDPFSAEPGARLYKTGDLARYLPDGNIEFLGRIDAQAKIRGHRIEPGEIEAALREHPAVRDAVVLAQEDVHGGKRLIAYVVLVQPLAAATGDLAAFLKGRLPAYMLPGHIVMLDALPLTPNGKVDRRKLPAPEDARAQRGADYVAPRDPLKQELVQIWEELLGVRPIGIRDDFFELGGHSLLAARMIHAIERDLGRKLPLSTLFAGATIECLAKALLQQMSGFAFAPVTTIHRDGSRPPFFFLHGDFGGGGLYCLKLARALGPEQPFHAIHPHGLDGGPAVPSSIEAMAADHLATVRAVQPRGPYYLGGHCNGGLIAFEMAQRLVALGERVKLLVLLDAPVENTWFGAGVVRGLVERVDAARGLTPEERLERFVRLRRRVQAAGDRAAYYWRRLHGLSAVRDGGLARVLARQARRSGEKLAALLGARRKDEAVPGDSAPASVLAGPDRKSVDEIEEIYRLAIAGYVPRRYDGPLTLFRSSASLQGGVGLEWLRVARTVKIHLVPGDHFTFFSRHVEAVGELLSAYLRNAQPK